MRRRDIVVTMGVWSERVAAREPRVIGGATSYVTVTWVRNDAEVTSAERSMDDGQNSCSRGRSGANAFPTQINSPPVSGRGPGDMSR